MKKTLCCITLLLSAALTLAGGKDLLKASGTTGGLVVCVGLENPALLTELGEGKAYLVHGLDEKASLVDAARKHAQKSGVYGQVSAARLTSGRLPYVSNSVNLLVLGSSAKVSPSEARRVLAPRGKALQLNGSGDVVKTIEKTLPKDTDEWTHYLYKSANNAVSKDTVVGPPRRMQWVAGPRYSRHHDKMSSVSAVVTSGGRVFSITDEGPRWSIMMEPEWVLSAQDAYNGKLLWQRPIADWHSHLFGLKSGPASLPRRLVALDDRVYATLGINTALVQIDAVTGKTLQEYKGTEGTTEILLDSGVLYLVCGPQPEGRWFAEGERTIAAVQADTGKILWQEKKWVVPSTLAVSDGRVYFFEKETVACLNAGTGKTVWQSETVPRPDKFPSCYTPTLVATPKIILISGGEAAGKPIFGRWSTKGETDTISGLDAATGKRLWSAHHGDSGYRSQEDVFVVDGKVWFGDTRDGAQPGNTYGLDLMTGEIKVEFPPDRDIYWFHHRCHRGKATENYLVTSRAGIEFIDFRKKHWEVNHWVRGACLYGVIPANGLVYAPQHPCACYLEVKLDGFNALAPANGRRLPATLPARLEKGPAFGTKAGDTTRHPEDWPTYRCDSKRSGSSRTKVADQVKPAFTVKVGGKLSSPVVSDGLLVTAAVDQHTVHAFDAETGKSHWSFTAGGRIDSPPTFHGKLLLFGCRDGYVYCLRAADGALSWRFRVAPVDERVVSYEQVESVWPVHGSLLIRDGAVWATAGRSTFLDGGLRLVRLEPETGKVLSETVLDGQAKVDGEDHQDYVTWLNMPPGQTDVLSSLGDYVYMRSQPFNPDGTRLPLKRKPTSGNPDAGAPPPDQDPAHAHLFAPTGFLDDTGWHRTYWVYGSDFYSGWQGYPTTGKVTPAGKIMCFDEDSVYGFGRQPQYWRWTTPLEFHFFAVSRDQVGQMKHAASQRKKKGNPAPEDAPKPKSPYSWAHRYPVLTRAMCKAGNTIFVAGPEDVLEETKMDQAKARRQVDLWNGKGGAVLMAISADGGAEKATCKLDSVPVFDGLIAARGRLYVTTTAGTIICLGR